MQVERHGCGVWWWWWLVGARGARGGSERDGGGSQLVREVAVMVRASISRRSVRLRLSAQEDAKSMARVSRPPKRDLQPTTNLWYTVD